MELLHIITQNILLFGLLFFLVYLAYSIYEKERRAVNRIIPIILMFGVILVTNNWLEFHVWVESLIGILFLSGLIIVLFPFGNITIVTEIPQKRYDERDIMFSRMELKEGTEKYENYYQRKPQNISKDNLFRKEPGLLSPYSKLYNPLLFSAAAATFSVVDVLQPLVEKGVSKQEQTKIAASEISTFLKNWMIKLGAVDVGFTLVQPHHLYSHIGRGENYGDEVGLNHKFAIAFTVEMNHESLSYTPKGPIIMESAQQYLNAGTIAVQVTQFIHNLGFDARAHIDANYRLICPIVAQDAGLGTIGRMGLLITPKLGPRVRVGVVTTDLELETNRNPIDSTLIQFCEICKKCAVNCPSDAISIDSAKKSGVWQFLKINHEKCFTYWCKVGTDCGRCITVCPYAHPNSFIHNCIRWVIKRNPVNRWLALKLDNYFYGTKPSPKLLKDCKIFKKI